MVFVPAVADLYRDGRQVTVSAGALGAVLEGAVATRATSTGC